MGLVILVITGSLFGWLTTIALRTESGREIGRNIVWGMAGSVLVGVAVANGMVLGSVRPLTLLLGLAGAAASVGLYNLIRHRRTPV